MEVVDTSDAEEQAELHANLFPSTTSKTTSKFLKSTVADDTGTRTRSTDHFDRRIAASDNWTTIPATPHRSVEDYVPGSRSDSPLLTDGRDYASMRTVSPSTSVTAVSDFFKLSNDVLLESISPRKTPYTAREKDEESFLGVIQPAATPFQVLDIFTPTSSPNLHQIQDGPQFSQNSELSKTSGRHASPLPDSIDLMDGPVLTTSEINHQTYQIAVDEVDADTGNGTCPLTIEAEHTAANEIGDRPRYSLRQRNLLQTNPYTAERRMYKRTLQNNPDAIVKYRSPERRRHFREDEYLESQSQSQDLMDIDRRQRHPPGNSMRRGHDHYDPPEECINVGGNGGNDDGNPILNLIRQSNWRSDSLPVSSALTRFPNSLLVSQPQIASTSKVRLEDLETNEISRQGSVTLHSEDDEPSGMSPTPGSSHDAQTGHNYSYPSRNRSSGATIDADSSESGRSDDQASNDSPSGAGPDPFLGLTRKQRKILARLRPDLMRPQKPLPQKRPRSSSPVSDIDDSISSQQSSPGAPREIIGASDSGEKISNKRSLRILDLDAESDDDVDEGTIRNYAIASTSAALRSSGGQGPGGFREEPLIDYMLSRSTRITNRPLKGPSTGRRKTRRRTSDRQVSHKPRGFARHHNTHHRTSQLGDAPLSVQTTIAHPRTEVQSSNAARKSNTRHAADQNPNQIGPPERLYQRSIRDWISVDSEDNADPPRGNANEGYKSLKRRLRIDCGINPVQSGLRFSANSYLTSGYLFELRQLAITADDVTPGIGFSGFGLLLNPSIDLEELFLQLPKIFEAVRSWLFQADQDIENDSSRSVDRLLRFLALYISKLSISVNESNSFAFLVNSVVSSVESLARDIEQHANQALSRNQIFGGRSVRLLWQLLDVSFRLAVVVKRQRQLLNDLQIQTLDRPLTIVRSLITQIIGNLLMVDLPKFSSEHLDDGDANPSGIILQAWICLIHFMHLILPRAFDSISWNKGVIAAVWAELERTSGSEELGRLELSERVWSTIFFLCSASQFSIQGFSGELPSLAPAWDVVEKALQCIKLTAAVGEDELQDETALTDRDCIIRLVASRCFLLTSRWKWSLKDGRGTFYALAEIFRSRNFADLRGEHNDFPSFILQNKISLRSVWQAKDTCHTSLMKFLIKMVEELGIKGPPLAKLLSVVVPVTQLGDSVNVDNSSKGVSMVTNRFTASYVAIILDPNNTTTRIRQCQRHVDFKRCGINTRSVCIRALMHIASLCQHLRRPLCEVSEWLTEMLQVLVEEVVTQHSCKQAVVRHANSTFAIQLLLGSCRKALEIQSLDDTKVSEQCPSTVFLEPAIYCVKHFPKAFLASEWRTADEIRKLIVSFLNHVPKLALKAPSIDDEPNGAQSESQEEYFNHFEIDLNNPGLLGLLLSGSDSMDKAAPGVNLEHSKQENEVKKAAKMLDESLISYFYSRLTKEVHDEYEIMKEPSSSDSRWVDCYVKCVAFVVHANIQPWRKFTALDKESWRVIPNANWRCWAGKRFALGILRETQGDTEAFQAMKDMYLEIFFQCIVTPIPIIEAEFMSRLICNKSDIALLNNVPEPDHIESAEFDREFRTFRDYCLNVFEVVCANTKIMIDRSPNPQQDSEIGQARVCFATMASHLVEFLQSLTRAKEQYYLFADHLTKAMLGLPIIGQDVVMRSRLNKARTLLPIKSDDG